MFVKSTRFKQVCQLLLSLIVAPPTNRPITTQNNSDTLPDNVTLNPAIFLCDSNGKLLNEKKIFPSITKKSNALGAQGLKPRELSYKTFTTPQT